MRCPYCDSETGTQRQYCPKCGHIIKIELDSLVCNHYWSSYEKSFKNDDALSKEQVIRVKKDSKYKIFGVLALLCCLIGMAVLAGVFAVNNINQKPEYSPDPAEMNAEQEEPNDSDKKVEIITPRNINDYVLKIREQYNNLQRKIANEKVDAQYYGDYFSVYYENGEIVHIAVSPGYFDDEYSRFYYYKDGSLFFSYYEAKDSHRFYFQDNILFRWRYCREAQVPSRADIHDLEETEEFNYWQEKVLSESDDVVEKVVLLSK